MQSNRDETTCHMGITCNGCQRCNFTGRRFRCLACLEDFNLCNGCYALDVTTNDHKFDHAMQCILTPFLGDKLKNGEHPGLIRCPYCKINNFNLNEFESHLGEFHPNADPELLLSYKKNL